MSDLQRISLLERQLAHAQRVIAAQASRITKQRAALEEGARDAMAGNGFAGLKQAILDDDRADEALARLISEGKAIA